MILKPWKQTSRKMAAALLCAMMAAGCASAGGDEKSPVKSIEITDDLGRTVSVEKPERVAALIGSFADEWEEAGGGKTLVAAPHDAWTQFDLDLEGVADLGGVKDIDQEALVDSDPDLVFASSKNESQKEMLETLENLEIPVVYFDVSDFEDYKRLLQVMTDLTGDEQAWQTYGVKQQEEIDAVLKKAEEQSEHPKVLALRATSKAVKALPAGGSLLGEMLASLKADNIAGNLKAETLSMEEIVEQDPDQIYLVYQGSSEDAQKMAEEMLFDNPAWQSLKAVRNDQVHILDGRLYNLKPNGRWAKAMEDLYGLLYES